MQRRAFATVVTTVLAWAGSARAEVTTGHLDVRHIERAPSEARTAIDRALPIAARLDLTKTDEVALPNGERLARFDQRWRGLPVLGRGVTVHIDAGGGATVRAALEPNLPARALPLLERSAAARTASRLITLQASSDDASLAVWPSPDGSSAAAPARLVWRVLPRADGLPFAPEILVDAESGTILRARERAVRVAGASMYRDNPTRTPGLESVAFPDEFVPAGDTLESAAIAARTCVDQKRLATFGSDRVHTCDLVSVARPSASGTYEETPDDDPKSATRDEDAFAEVSMYSHLARVYAFFRGLAPPGTTRIVAGKAPFVAVANLRLAPGLDGHGDLSRAGDPTAALVPFANAFFAPANDGFGALFGTKAGGLWFGQGPERDYAYDGDVVYHEFTHAVVDATMSLASYVVDDEGLSAAPGALNEGLADYFAAALSGDPDVGEYAAKDFDASLPYVRTLANDDTCVRMSTGEVHFDSTAFSGALWEARAALSPVERIVLDRLVYQTLLAHPRFDTPTFPDMIALLDATLDRRSSLAARALRAALARRGFAPGCSRVVEATSVTVASPSDLMGRVGYQAPGAFETGLALTPGVATFRTAVAPGMLVVRFSGKERTAGGIFAESGGKAFAPEVLVAFDAPIRWHGAAHDAPFDQQAKVDANDAGQYRASIPVPDGARLAYVQIANSGDRSGIYDGIRLTVEAPPLDPSPRTVLVDEPEDGVAPASASGCSIGASPRSLPALAFVVPLALAATRRRRTRRAR